MGTFIRRTKVKISVKILIVSVLILLFIVPSLSAQETTKRYAGVVFDYHNATWEFEELPKDNKNLVYYSVSFNAGSVMGYELFEFEEKKSICKVYYDNNNRIEKWEIFNGRKISHTADFNYKNGRLYEIKEYTHRGKVVQLEKVHQYDGFRTKLEIYSERNVIVREFHYWDNGAIKLEGNYQAGKKDGPWLYKDRYDRLTMKEEYVLGELIAVSKFYYGDNGEKTKKVLMDADGKIYYTTAYKYDFDISITDPVEIRLYRGDMGELVSITYAEFDAKTNEFIAMIRYNTNCEIISLQYVIYPNGKERGGKWMEITDKEEIEEFLKYFNFDSSCSI